MKIGPDAAGPVAPARLPGWRRRPVQTPRQSAARSSIMLATVIWEEGPKFCCSRTSVSLVLSAVIARRAPMRVTPLHSTPFLAAGLYAGRTRPGRAAQAMWRWAPRAPRLDGPAPVSRPWLDWASRSGRRPSDRRAPDRPGGGLSHRSPAGRHGPVRHAHRLAAWGWRLGVFDTADDAVNFREAVFGLFALGLAAPGPAPSWPSAPGRSRSPSIQPWRQADLLAVDPLAVRPAPHRVLALPSAPAWQRCGPAPSPTAARASTAACADPAANPALARAALEGRAAGAATAISPTPSPSRLAGAAIADVPGVLCAPQVFRRRPGRTQRRRRRLRLAGGAPAELEDWQSHPGALAGRRPAPWPGAAWAERRARHPRAPGSRRF